MSFLFFRSDDMYIKTHSCQVNLRYSHNHDIATPAALKYRDSAAAVRKLFEELFKNNHSPSLALQTYKFHLKQKWR